MASGSHELEVRRGDDLLILPVSRLYKLFLPSRRVRVDSETFPTGILSALLLKSEDDTQYNDAYNHHSKNDNEAICE